MNNIKNTNEARKKYIQSLRDEGKSVVEISKIIGISKWNIYKILKPTYQKTGNAVGRPSLITGKVKKVVREAIRRIKKIPERVTSYKILSQTKLNLSERTIRRALSVCNYQYKNLPKKIQLNDVQKENRKLVVKEWIAQGINFKKIIFSDEKKFNFDGPDHYMSWCSKNEKSIRNKRVCGGGGLMVHGILSSEGYIRITRVDGTIDTQSYICILTDVFAYLKENYDDFIYMHDGAPSHKSKKTLAFISEQAVNLLNWPAYSPDMNIIENLWHMISENVYKGPQFREKEHLWTAIQLAVEEINNSKRDVIVNLYKDYANRIVKLFEKNGDIIN